MQLNSPQRSLLPPSTPHLAGGYTWPSRWESRPRCSCHSQVSWQGLLKREWNKHEAIQGPEQLVLTEWKFSLPPSLTRISARFSKSVFPAVISSPCMIGLRDWFQRFVQESGSPKNKGLALLQEKRRPVKCFWLPRCEHCVMMLASLVKQSLFVINAFAWMCVEPWAWRQGCLS